MSRFYSAVGVIGAGVCGYLIARTTLEPELENQRLERLGETINEAPAGDKVISTAIMSDLQEAKEQVTDTSGGFAWGIRQAIFGKPGQRSPAKEIDASPQRNVSERDNTNK